MSQWHAHSRAVVLHNLYRVQRDTRLFTLLVNFAALYFLFCCPSTGVFLSSPRHSSPPSSSATSASASRAFARSITACSHHRIPNRSLGALSDSSHRSNSYRVAIYCATVLWRRLTYSSIIKKPAASLAAAAEVYLHVPPVVLRGSCPISRLATWV